MCMMQILAQAAMLYRQPRLVASSNVSVAEYSAVMEAYMQQQGSRDLHSLLQGLEQHCTWKSAPRLECLVQYAGLYKLLFNVVPNTICSHARLVDSLLAAHNERKCLFTTNVLRVEAGILSQLIRIGASKYRTVKADTRSYHIIMQKATPVQTQVLREVLQLIDLNTKRLDLPKIPDSWTLRDHDAMAKLLQARAPLRVEEAQEQPCEDAAELGREEAAAAAAELAEVAGQQLVPLADVGPQEPQSHCWPKLPSLRGLDSDDECEEEKGFGVVHMVFMENPHADLEAAMSSSLLPPAIKARSNRAKGRRGAMKKEKVKPLPKKEKKTRLQGGLKEDRKNVHSRAWHKAEQIAKKKGWSPHQVKVFAKQEARKAVVQFEGASG